jgi:adenylate cyclase
MPQRPFHEISRAIVHGKDRNDAEELFRLADELNAFSTPSADALACDARGWALYLTSDNAKAVEVYKRALDLYAELGDRSGEASASGNLGSVFSGMGEYTKALEYQHRSMDLYASIGDLKGVAANLGNIGIVHRENGDHAAALEYYHRALAIHEQRNDRGGVATITGNIGNLHRATGNYPAALECLERALALDEEEGDRMGVALVTGNIGIIYDLTGDHAMAMDYYRRALALHDAIGDRNGVARVTSNIGRAHLSAGEHASAMEHLQHALELFTALDDRIEVAGVSSSLAEVHLALGSDANAQALLDALGTEQFEDPSLRIQLALQRSTLRQRSGDLDGAAALLDQSMAEATKHGLRMELAQCHKALRELARVRNDLAGYVEHNDHYTRITEEINGKETAAKLATQAKQREIDEREREHAKHLAVLHSTLPKHIADRVARGETVNDHVDHAVVLFLDIVGFTALSDSMSPGHVVDLLGQIFSSLDDVCKEHTLTKIKTIGDCYMAVAFQSSEQRGASSEQLAASAAIAMLHMMSERFPRMQVRIGVHCGPVTAGVIGTERLQYDVWGDTVNVASRLEGTSEPGRIHVSEAFANVLRSSSDPAPFTIIPRGEVEIKGKGAMTTYWLEGTA